LLSRKQEHLPMSSLTAAVDLLPTSGSVPVARHVAVELLKVWQAPHDPDDVALLVTELVTNVVDHVDGEAVLTLELALAADSLKIAVADGSSIRPVVRQLNAANPRGRGLQLVQAIADGWGIEDHHGGKRVWLTLQHPPS
jgi:anti-sigma regulatory factor (Ser/Thr protein kinase)